MTPCCKLLQSALCLVRDCRIWETFQISEEVFAEAMELLGPDIAMVHFKDFIRVPEGHGLKAVGAGTGEMDYTSIMKFIKQEKPFLYGTLENTIPENAALCGARMKALYDEA